MGKQGAGPVASKQLMSDLLVTAWEGGSNYWVESAEYIPPEGMSVKEFRDLLLSTAFKEEFEDVFGKPPPYALLPYLPPKIDWKVAFRAGGEEADDSESDVAYLTPQNMREALPKLAKAHPRNAKNITSDNYDAGDADAWLQTALFGKVIFG